MLVEQNSYIRMPHWHFLNYWYHTRRSFFFSLVKLRNTAAPRYYSKDLHLHFQLLFPHNVLSPAPSYFSVLKLELCSATEQEKHRIREDKVEDKLLVCFLSLAGAYFVLPTTPHLDF